MLPRLLPALLLACAAPVAAAASLDLAWWRDGKVQAVQLQQRSASAAQPMAASTEIPLGSLWKLFVYVYAVDNKLPMPDYNCGGRKQEEVYCCEAGASVSRDAALAQSCGLFFAPERLGIAQKPWQDYWKRRLGSAPAGEFAWLADPARLEPARLVTLGSLLRVLASIPAASRADAEAALLRVVLDGRGAGSVRWFGSQLRVKTYSWHHPKREDARLGGAAAGWPTALPYGLAAATAAPASSRNGRRRSLPPCRRCSRRKTAAAWWSTTSPATLYVRYAQRTALPRRVR